MIRTPLLLTLAAAAALAGCDQNGNTIVQQGPPDTMANELAAAPPVELPPAIAATNKYRCDDGTVVSIDWLEKNNAPAGANIRVGESTTPTQLLPGAEGNAPFTAADGSSLTGTKDASSVNLTLPGKGAQSCKA